MNRQMNRRNTIRIVGIVMVLATLMSLTGSVFAFAPAAGSTAGAADVQGSLADSSPARVIEPQNAAGPDYYIVQLVDAPLASYRGGIDGLTATSPSVADARQLDVESAASAAYLSYLDSKQVQTLTAIEQALGRAAMPLHRYRYAFNGFAIELTPKEAAQVASLAGVRQLQRNVMRQPLTDYGPAWIGAPGIWDGSDTGGLPGTQGEGVIVGIIDTGINMDHPSFADVGGDGYDHDNPFGAGNYVGLCATNPALYECNDKLIGVWNYADGPEDLQGHGSHTASTAAGNVVLGAPLAAPTFVYNADISGVAPHVNIIAYDACSDFGCGLIGLVAAIDQTVVDGVDVINYSIGGASSNPWLDSDAQAFLGAFDAGIVAAVSAGNSGPGAGTIGSPADAPWVLTAGASTHNRVFANALINMSGGNTPPPADIFGKSIAAGHGPALIVFAGDFGDAQCLTPFPANTWTNDEIVVCDRGQIARVEKGQNVLAGGAGGFILANDIGNGNSVSADPHFLPAVHITYDDGVVLKNWLADGGSGHTATIAGTSTDLNPANGDIMAGFSSRGPDPAVGDIIKPDVTAPGVDIFAAYKNGEEYSVVSGTSMSSPHTAGSAALLRALRPDWSAAEIKSALMSTGWTTTMLKEDGVTPTDPFDMGAGRVDLSVAGRAGLLLDETTADFQAANPGAGGDPTSLNLASLSNEDCVGTCSWTRTVAGTVAETWTASATAPGGMSLTITPSSFSLTPGATQELTIEADVSGLPLGSWAFAEVTLSPAGATPAAHFPVAVTPTQGGGCAATVALADAATSKSDLAILRQFRDEVMAASPAGQKYIDLYYKHSPEVVWMLLKDAELRTRTATVLAEFMPGIRSLLGQTGGRELVLTATRVQQVEALLSELASRGGSELGQALTEVAGDIASYEGKPLRAVWLSSR